MKRKRRYGDITIHNKAYVGGVLRGKYPHRRMSFSEHALKRVSDGARRTFSVLALPFLFVADFTGRCVQTLAKQGRRKTSGKVSIFPLYEPTNHLDDAEARDAKARRPWEMPTIIGACVLVPAAIFLLAFFVAPAKPEGYEVYVNDQGTTVGFLTDAETVGEFLAKSVNIDAHDIVEANGSAPIHSGMLINVKRAFPVLVSSRQNTRVIEVAGGTVGDALNELSINVDENDIVTPGLGEPVKPGMKIEHIGVTVSVETETIKIPFKKTVKKDSSLVKGKTKLKTEGRSGSKEILSRVTLHDGVEIGREVIEEKLLRAPVDQVTLEGTASDTVSVKRQTTLRNDTRANKAPPKKSQIKTTLVIEATAYTHTGNRTATGTQPKIGTIAVDPKVIPYGTKLYVEGYGYGKAEDTGGFRGNSKKQIDLFMDTVKECINWGRKTVTVYILK